MKKRMFFAVMVAIMMVTMTVSFNASDDNDALTPSSNLELNEGSTVIYVASGTNHSTTYSVKTSTIPAGYSGADVSWRLVDLDDGNCISFSDTAGVFVATGGSVTVYGRSVGSVELIAEIVDGDLEEDYIVSVVVVVFSSPTANATKFHFFFQIDPAGYAYAVQYARAHGDLQDDEELIVLPANKTMADFETGFWVTVDQSSVSGTFNALTALQWYLGQNSWSNNIFASGWIQDLLGLDTYPGDDGKYYYWAQYHAVPDTSEKGGQWAFNNTTLSYITSVDSSYIGLIFWGSPDSFTMPDFPGYDTA